MAVAAPLELGGVVLSEVGSRAGLILARLTCRYRPLPSPFSWWWLSGLENGLGSLLLSYSCRENGLGV